MHAYLLAKSNLIEIQRIETPTYIFEKLNNECKVEIIFIKSVYLNGRTEFYETILALLENFFILLRSFFSSKNKTVASI